MTFASSPWPCSGCHTWFEGDGKGTIERLCLSPYVEEPLNSKVIKSFVPELRSRKFFSCFGIPMLYIYIYIYIYVMNTLCTFPIFMYGYVTFLFVVYMQQNLKPFIYFPKKILELAIFKTIYLCRLILLGFMAYQQL